MMGYIRNEKEERKFLSFVHAIFRQEYEGRILQELGELDVPRPYGLKVKVVYSPEGPASTFESLAKRGVCRHISSSAKAYVFRRRDGRTDGGKESVPFLVASLRNVEDGSLVAAIVSICRRQSWRRLRSLIEHQYPNLVPILLSQNELLGAVDSLKQMTGHEIRVVSRSAKEQLDVGKRRPRKSVREWTDETLEEMRRTIEERGQILTSLDTEFYRTIDNHAHITPTATCKIRKEGEIEVSGSFRLAFESVASYIASVGAKKLKLYHGRGLRDADYKPRPLSIVYSQPVFEDLSTVRGLVTTLTKHKHSMHTIIHGNPYMHMRITDLHDGSSFDVWAIPPRRLEIVPGLKATEAAIERLVHYIFDGFREGKVATHGE